MTEIASKAGLIARFCAHINRGPEKLEEALAAVSDDSLRTMLEQAYQEASRPTRFLSDRYTSPSPAFEQGYHLLSKILDADVIDPIEFFRNRLRVPDPAAMTFIMMRRYWQTQGACEYDDEGQLTHFDYDPDNITEHTVSVITGDYISFSRIARYGYSMAGIGQLVTRTGEQWRGQGHGTALVRAFEAECEKMAQARGEQMKTYLVESEGDAQRFWAKMGYRWVVNSRYYQPPIDWDYETGERRFDEVPELLMIKVVGQPDSQSIDSQLLRDTVRATYLDWYIPIKASPIAREKIEAYVFDKLYADFEDSIENYGDTVPLSLPPKYQG
ncbi:MAG: GNAT family N-acetyltransferase [Anaerolineae bacterium]|nr:GNAT family N-acetyltransferase [Anaerolineae bacterium]